MRWESSRITDSMSPTHARPGAEQRREGDDEMDSEVGGISVWGARQHGPQCVHERTTPTDSVIL